MTTNSNDGIAQRLAMLEDREALRTLKYRYAEAVDRCVADPTQTTAAAVAEMFTADGHADFGQFGQYDGRDGIATFFQTVLPTVTAWTRHYMHNPILQLDGDRATGRWYAVAESLMRAALEAGPQTLYVRYEDTYVKTEHGWRLQTVIVHFDTPGP
jgi:hypothetical protein